METCMSFGYCSVVGNVDHYKEFEETFQLARGGSTQSILILEKRASPAYQGHPSCVKCGSRGHHGKSSIFDIFWDQINGKCGSSVQPQVCQQQGIYSLGCYNVYMYVLYDIYIVSFLFLFISFFGEGGLE